MKAARSFAILCVIVLLPGQAAVADEPGDMHPWLTSTFGLEIGIFHPDRSNRFRALGSIDFDPQPSQFVDFAEEFKVSSSDSTFAAELAWNYGERWSLRMQYFDSTGSSTAVLEEDIVWEDLVFLEGTSATAGAGFELTRAVWGYTVDNRPNYDIDLLVGFHWLHIRGFIEGTVRTPTGSESARESASVDAPLPNIGLEYLHSLSPRWAFRTRFDWFSADIDPYDGIFINASVGFNFRLTEMLNLGAKYNYVELDVGVSGSNWRGEVETRYDGLYIYVGASW